MGQVGVRLLRLISGQSIFWLWLCSVCLWAYSGTSLAQDQETKPAVWSTSYVFVSDAMDALGQGDSRRAQQQLRNLQSVWQGYAQNLPASSPAHKQIALVQSTLQAAMDSPDTHHLALISNALIQAERRLQPVDYTAKRTQFLRATQDALKDLDQLTQAQSQNLSAWQTAFQHFYAQWLRHERVVRNTSLGHYGQIETALALLRVAIVQAEGIGHLDDTLRNKLIHHTKTLDRAMQSYATGTSVTGSPAKARLSDGIGLLQQSEQALRTLSITIETPSTAITAAAPLLSQAQKCLNDFILLWPAIENAVSTRDSALYRRIEARVPLLLAHTTSQTSASEHQQNAEQLRTLILDLQAINPDAHYSWVDAMLILLREGVEAMLIILALLSALTASQQARGKPWVYAGVIAGVGVSVLAALALQQWWPQNYAAQHRETLEAMVGLATVLLMLWIGFWLHSKSSMQQWNAFIRSQMQKALSTGRLLSLMALSFVAVLREGAETIVFYAGIMPRISTRDFMLGIACACLLLAALAWILFKTSIKLPIPRLFQVLTLVIYALGFKILGISIHTLQLTGHLPFHTLAQFGIAAWLQSLPQALTSSLGLYLSREGLMAQALYVGFIVLVFCLHQHPSKDRSNAA